MPRFPNWDWRWWTLGLKRVHKPRGWHGSRKHVITVPYQQNYHFLLLIIWFDYTPYLSIICIAQIIRQLFLPASPLLASHVVDLFWRKGAHDETQIWTTLAWPWFVNARTNLLFERISFTNHSFLSGGWPASCCQSTNGRQLLTGFRHFGLWRHAHAWFISSIWKVF